MKFSDMLKLSLRYLDSKQQNLLPHPDLYSLEGIFSDSNTQFTSVARDSVYFLPQHNATFTMLYCGDEVKRLK